MKTGVLIVTLLVIGAALAGQSTHYYAMPVKNPVGVYENEVRKVFEQATFMVTTENRLIILDENRDRYQIQDEHNRVGWVDKNLVARQKSSKRLSFSHATVQGYTDDPAVIIITGGSDPRESPIVLDRSFTDELKLSVDRETLTRTAGRE